VHRAVGRYSDVQSAMGGRSLVEPARAEFAPEVAVATVDAD
jgi:hypothetical protein